MTKLLTYIVGTTMVIGVVGSLLCYPVLLIGVVLVVAVMAALNPSV